MTLSRRTILGLAGAAVLRPRPAASAEQRLAIGMASEPVRLDPMRSN